MKRVIYGMAFPRKVAMNNLARNAAAIRDHIIKCVVYKDSMPDQLYHWIHDELCLWLESACKVRCKVKLKRADIEDSLFGELGDEPGDARVILDGFVSDYCRPDLAKQYPVFEITKDLEHAVFIACAEIKEVVTPRILNGDVVSKDDWYALIRPIFI